MPRQRWYAAKGRPPSLRLIAWWELGNPFPGDDARLRTLLVVGRGVAAARALPDPDRRSARRRRVEAEPEHIIGSPEPGTTFVDGAVRRRLRPRALHPRDAGRRGPGPEHDRARHPDRSCRAERANRTRPCCAASSPTRRSSSAARTAGRRSSARCSGSCIRDSVPTSSSRRALADAGSAHVPRAIGSIEARWPDTATSGGTVLGSLAFAQEFLPGVEDAWRVALRAAARRRRLQRARASPRRRDGGRAPVARRALPHACDRS